MVVLVALATVAGLGLVGATPRAAGKPNRHKLIPTVFYDWSPFNVKAKSGGGMRTARPNGKHVRAVAGRGGRRGMGPVSPDGRLMIPGETGQGVSVMKTDGRGFHTLFRSNSFGRPQFGPNGVIVFPDTKKIPAGFDVINVDGSGQRRVYSETIPDDPDNPGVPCFCSGGSLGNADLSNDGQWLVFSATSNYAGDVPANGIGTGDFVVSAAGGAPIQIIDSGPGSGDLEEGANPVFSPDGSRVLVRYLGNIWITNAHAFQSGLRCLTCGSGLFKEYFNPSFSPDGSRIVFDGGQATSIGVVGVNGGAPHALFKCHGRCFAPQWANVPASLAAHWVSIKK